MSDYEPPQPIIFPPIFNSVNWPSFEDQVVGGGGGGGGVGPQGPQGTGGIGNQGFQGRQGPQGNQGNAGTIGVNGNQGFQGNQGVAGVGVQGAQGAQGLQGAGEVYLGENLLPSTFGTLAFLGGTTGIQGANLENNNTTFSVIPSQYFNTVGSFWRTPLFGGGGDYFSCAMSATGQVRIMLPDGSSSGFVSQNFGRTWTSTSIPGTSHETCRMSADGQYIITTASNAFAVSNNFGVSWTTPLTGLSSSNQNGCGMSASGKYMYASARGAGVYRSSNFGVSFTLVLTDTTTPFYGGIGVSASGQYVLLPAGFLAGGVPNPFNYDCRLSKDYGQTWTVIATGLGGSARVSASGQYMYHDTTGNFISSNYGATFSSISFPAGYGGPQLSNNGQYIYVVQGNPISLAVSKDFGKSFQVIFTSTVVEVCYGNGSCSGSGQYVMLPCRNTAAGGFTPNITFAMNFDMSLSRQDQTNIVLNATSQAMNVGGTGGATGFYVKPIRNGATGSQILSYDNTSGEIQYTPRSYYAQYYDTTDQAHAGGTGQSITFNTTDFQSGISLVSGSQITVSQTGKYALSFSLQFINTDSQEQYVDVFFWKNGSVLADSNSEFAITRTQSGINGKLIAATTLFFDLVATDYLELYWYSISTDVDLEYIAAGTYVPATPSAFVNIQLISS